MSQVLIVHGYSDSSVSFHALAEFLRANGHQPRELWLGDYISKDDDVRVIDVGKRMEEVIRAMIADGSLAASFDMIVHSTGGLVAREWLTAYYAADPTKCPMKRLVMLAPANFGSVLAAKGKSLLGRVAKGWDNGLQSGRNILNDLELSSPFQWQLAQRDVLVPAGHAPGPVFYRAGAVWPFVIVGTHPYPSLFRQLINEDGGDGTVRVCAANLNAVGMTIDFSDPAGVAVNEWQSALEAPAPLAVLPTRTHASIIDPERSNDDSAEGIVETAAQKAQLGACILEALACASYDQYKAIGQRWNDITEATAALVDAPGAEKPAIYHQFLQADVYVTDDHGNPVDDYFLEFVTADREHADEADLYLHREVIATVTKNSQSEACRCVYVDRTDLLNNYYDMIPAGIEKTLFMTISAAPPGPNIRYFSGEGATAEGRVPIHNNSDVPASRWLKRNSTHFVKIVIPRRPGANVFRLTRYDRA